MLMFSTKEMKYFWYLLKKVFFRSLLYFKESRDQISLQNMNFIFASIFLSSMLSGHTGILLTTNVLVLHQ